MANNLGRDLVKGEVLVVNGGGLFVAAAEGFGSFEVCAGQAVFGHWLDDGQAGRIQGNDIDRAATEKFHEEQAGAKIPQEVEA